MFKTLKKAKVTNSVLVAITVCFFVLSKSKQPVKPSTKVSVPTTQQISQSKEIPSLGRVFSKQLNRRKHSPRFAFKKAPQQRTQKKLITKKKKTSPSPELVRLSNLGLEEAPQGAVFNPDPYESLTVLDPQFSLVVMIPREVPVNIYEGILVAQDFSEVRGSLASYPQPPKLVAFRKPVSKDKSVPTEKNSSELLAQNDTSPQPVLQAPKIEPEPAVSIQKFLPRQASPTEVSDLIERGRTLLRKLSTSQRPTPSKHSNRNAIPGVESTRVSTEPVGKIYGKLTLDLDTQEWLDSLKGHVELRLQKAQSQDPQDIFFVDYRYPERDFFWDGRQVSGEYRLIASFFEPSKPVAFAQVVYPKALNAENSKQMVVFHISKTQLRDSIDSASAQNREGVVLSGTVFEANTGDHTESKTISNAEISVVGFPEWGIFKADKEGTFRIPKVSAQSEYLLSVQAPGYYPTEVIAPIFQTTGYVSVHLVSKNHVDTITRFFTKRPQDEKKGIVFGRVFDPRTRGPQPDQEVSLSGRRGKALYFGILPDQALNQTTASGVFAYFNVEPAFRSVGRAERSAHELFQVKPGSAYHIEMGRSGETHLRGRLFDPYRQQAVIGRVKVVGSPLSVDSNELGEFEIKGIDLSPGILTLEVESPGYPNSWHTISWSARDRKEKYTLYLPETDLLYEVQTAVAKLSEQPGLGSLLGGAQPQFFSDLKKCVYVSLEDSGGQPALNTQGPYPLHRGDYDPSKPLCLTKDRPGFSFFNLEPGQYILKWKTIKGNLLRTHIVRVGADRTTILIN